MSLLGELSPLPFVNPLSFLLELDLLRLGHTKDFSEGSVLTGLFVHPREELQLDAAHRMIRGGCLIA